MVHIIHDVAFPSSASCRNIIIFPNVLTIGLTSSRGFGSCYPLGVDGIAPWKEKRHQTMSTED